MSLKNLKNIIIGMQLVLSVMMGQILVHYLHDHHQNIHEEVFSFDTPEDESGCEICKGYLFKDLFNSDVLLNCCSFQSFEKIFFYSFSCSFHEQFTFNNKAPPIV